MMLLQGAQHPISYGIAPMESPSGDHHLPQISMVPNAPKKIFSGYNRVSFLQQPLCEAIGDSKSTDSPCTLDYGLWIGIIVHPVAAIFGTWLVAPFCLVAHSPMCDKETCTLPYSISLLQESMANFFSTAQHYRNCSRLCRGNLTHSVRRHIVGPTTSPPSSYKGGIRSSPQIDGYLVMEHLVNHDHGRLQVPWRVSTTWGSLGRAVCNVR